MVKCFWVHLIIEMVVNLDWGNIRKNFGIYYVNENGFEFY